MTRRSGQSGSVMKKRGKWYGRYYADVPGQEERVRKSVLLGAAKEMGKSEARRKLWLFLETEGVNSNPGFVEAKRQGKTFAQQLRWWEDNKLALSKLAYQDVVRMRLKHIMPYFGSMLIDEIGEDQVQEFITLLSRTTYTTADGVQHKLSPGYIRDIVSTLKRIIGGKAAHWDLTLPAVPYIEQRYFTQEEMLQIIAAATGKWKVLFALLADTGLRCGEAFGLHIEDLDLDAGRVLVRRSIWQGIEVTPKTRKGYRAVDVNPELCEMLKQHIGSRTTGYVLETRNGTPLCEGNSRRTLQEILKQLGIPKGGLHAFRHGRVSVLQSNGVPGELIKEWVGHSTLRVTARYTHFTENFRGKEAKRAGLLASGSEEEAGLLAPDSPHGPQFSRTGDVNEMAKAVAA